MELLMRRIAITLVAAAAWLVITPADAYAQMTLGSFKGFLTGHVGAIAGDALNNEDLVLGASISVQEQSGWGAEIDFGHSSDAVAGRQILDVSSYLVNAAWVKPRGLVRPFAIAGAGVLQINGCDSPCSVAALTSDFAMNVGGGAFLVFNDYVALRGDTRYIFSNADHPDLHRPENFSYWRFTIGATFMWTILP
jgi:hypothetical protein